MSKRLPIYLLAVLCAAVSCHSHDDGAWHSVALAGSIAADQNCAERVLLSAPVSSDGEIYIAGSPLQVRAAQEAFLSADSFDNARGRSWGDGLRDFAGETFSCIKDGVFSPYSKFIENGKEDALRELSVRYALAALDTLANVSIYDLEGNAPKTKAKMLVLADPWLCEYGKKDIDYLFSATGCKVPVISVQQALFDAALGGEVKSFNIGLICEPEYEGRGIYPAIFAERVKAHDVVGARFFESSAANLAEFLDIYAASGATAPLDAILIDSPSVDPASVAEELRAMKDFSREESMNYGKLVSDGMRIFSSSEEAIKSCYSVLRSENLFTHRIAQPQTRNYSVESTGTPEGVEFLLIPR